jgi:hypothetical protein
MSGSWETRLKDLASSRTDVMLPNAQVVQQRLNELHRTMLEAASEGGFEGKTGQAAAAALESTSKMAHSVSSSIQDVKKTVESANKTKKDLANAEIDKLDRTAPGSLSAKDATVLQAAVTGATFMFGPLSIIAGPGAVAVVNHYLAAHRESAAKAAVERISTALDGMAPTAPDAGKTGDKRSTDDPGGIPGSGDQTGTGSRGDGYRPPSFHSYPDAHIEPLSQVDTSGVISFPFQGGGGAGGGIGGGGSTGQPGLPGTGVDGSITPDGPISGGTTHPGGGSAGGGFGGGSTGGGLGTMPGIAAGAGGALALGGAKLVAVKGGSALGGGLSGARGGLLGAGGAGAGAKVGGLGAAAEASAARTAGLNGAAASRMGSGGLLGAGAQGAAGEAGAGAARGGAGMMGGAPAQGGRDEGKRQGRGLGGPIAPKLEEDQDRGARSAAAGPGGRA